MAGGDVENLPAIRIFLPTRRACRDAQTAFLRAFDGKPVLLPKLQPLGDVDPDDLTLQLAGFDPEISAQDLEIPPAISPLHRTLLLTRLVQARDKERSTDMAVALAEELGRLMDNIHTEGLDLADLPDLVDESSLSRHWQITLEFLTILSEAWPEILKERGVIDAADRRNRLMRLLTQWYETTKPEEITIAAGTSGSIPATAALLKAIANLPNGYVVLPGLDQNMTEQDWAAVGPTHPQYSLKQLLGKLETSPKDVRLWSQSKSGSRPELQRHRQWLGSEMMRPADTLDQWAHLSMSKDDRRQLSRSLKHVRLLTCDSPEQEAQSIALALRETLEHDGKTAALVTPDRTLARRVSAACQRWGLIVDDSGGVPLTREHAGSWLMLTAKACNADLSPLALLSMLKHPFASCGGDPGQSRLLVREIERRFLRGPAPENGLDGLKEKAKDMPGLVQVMDHILTATQTYRELAANNKRHSFSRFLNAHIDMCESLAGGPEHVWIGEDGEAAALLLADLNDSGRLLDQVTAREYAAILRRLMDQKSIRPKFGAHPRLSILGQLEARLIDADLVILAGLNEGTWPPEAPKDPWMSRPMREKFGLPSPDESIGKAAHDFMQLFTAPNVIMTRSSRVDGTPTVPARWLQRLDAVLDALNTPDATPKLKIDSGPYGGWANKLDKIPEGTVRIAEQPKPTPPVESRPRTLGVTSIEKWMRDPYHIYAQKILELEKLDPIEKDEEARELGQWVHDVLHEFVSLYPDQIPEDALDRLREIGREKLGSRLESTRVYGFWWPKFEKIIDWFVRHEIQWRQQARPVKDALESKGNITIDSTAGPFTLTAKVDRIDRMKADGSYVIIDYKTGQSPGPRDVKNGLSPQLPLEAVILEQGGFPAISNGGEVCKLQYWQITGSKSGTTVKTFQDTHKGKIVDRYLLADVIENARTGVETLIREFDKQETPYTSLPRAQAAPPEAYQDYAQLARVKEWSGGGEDMEAEAS